MVVGKQGGKVPDKEALYETLDLVIAADVQGLWEQSIWVTNTDSATADCFWSGTTTKQDHLTP